MRVLLATIAALAAAAFLWLAAPAFACSTDSGCADVSVSGHAEPQPIRKGERTTLKITPKNNGPGSTYGIKVTAEVPKQLKVKSTRIIDGRERKCSDNGYGFIECYPGDFRREQQSVIKIKVKAKRKGTFITPVKVYSQGTTDPNGGNNQVSITVGVGGRGR
jgi:translation initiation factor 1 (eIF-1/SUI1)